MYLTCAKSIKTGEASQFKYLKRLGLHAILHTVLTLTNVRIMDPFFPKKKQRPSRLKCLRFKKKKQKKLGTGKAEIHIHLLHSAAPCHPTKGKLDVG